MADPPASDDKAWVEHWARVGPALDRIRRQELRAFKHEDNVDAIDALLQIGVDHATPRETSGLVELQRILHQRTQ